jgi:hypothetical protein
VPAAAMIYQAKVASPCPMVPACISTLFARWIVIAYGQNWRGAAAAELRELGFDPPQGFELWS